ncbi:hypothetical protein ACFL03_00340 [Thermodesulfobacteriota bacterium]
MVLIGVALVFFAFWQIGEPARRARKIHKNIHPGMNFKDVESFMSGRYYCDYQVMADGEWKSIQRVEFIKLLELGTKNSFPSKRLWLTFLGMAPGRVSFFVEFDSSGRVSEVTDPHGWD